MRKNVIILMYVALVARIHRLLESLGRFVVTGELYAV